MVAGLVRRYQLAGVPHPEIIYTDHGCCGSGGMKEMFSEWGDVCVRLDIWHFMRCIASGCTTESHPLYGTFIGRLSQCIFEWSSEDLDQLRRAKIGELEGQRGSSLSNNDVMRKITKKELALHCRRRTRDVDATTELLKNLLDTFSGSRGRDTLSVPLLQTKGYGLFGNPKLSILPAFRIQKGSSYVLRLGY